jgi:hypothetical protein
MAADVAAQVAMQQQQLVQQQGRIRQVMGHTVV